MTSHSHRFCLLIGVAALLTVTLNAVAAPELGRYVGTLRVRKTLPPYYTNALSVTTTIRVVAEVIQNHTNRTINILAALRKHPWQHLIPRVQSSEEDSNPTALA